MDKSGAWQYIARPKTRWVVSAEMDLICIFDDAMQNVEFTYLSKNNIAQIVPLMQDFTANKYSDEVLLDRLKGMFA